MYQQFAKNQSLSSLRRERTWPYLTRQEQRHGAYWRLAAHQRCVLCASAAGVGPRKCIGYKFALEEAAQLHRRFTFRLDPARHPGGADALELSTGITLSVKGGLWVVPVPRS